MVVCEIMGISNTNLSIKHGIYTAKKKIGFAKFILNFTKVQNQFVRPIKPDINSDLNLRKDENISISNMK